MASATRRTIVTTALATVAAGTLLSPQTAAASEAATTSPAAGRHRPQPLPRAHAHNDYLHTRPLYEALGHGFTSVEADIFLVDGELLVAHEATDLDPARNVSSLYLDPLLARVRANHGRVWTELLAFGVDHLNTDDLAGLERFLRTDDQDPRSGAAHPRR